MSHSVTCKLNKDARQHTGQSGTTFFVSLGEKNYNFKTKETEWTNYEAALFAKDSQVQFYSEALIEGAIIEVKGSGLLLEMPDDPQYKPRLQIQDAKLGFVHNQSVGVPAMQQPMQQAPVMAQQQVDYSALIQQYKSHDTAARTAMWATLGFDQQNAINKEFA